MDRIARFVPVTDEEREVLIADDQRLETALARPSASHLMPLIESVGPGLTLERTWHGVHYLLCGEAAPGAKAISHCVLGGTEFGFNYGGGRPRYFTPAETAALARGLRLFQPKPADPQRMNELAIYPGGWGPDSAAALLRDWERLRDFYSYCRQNGLGIITCLI